MVHALKNIAIRLWIAATSGGLATLGLLAVLGSPLKPLLNLAVAAALIILAFLGCGWLFNRIAALRVQDCLREATARERTARIGEAAEAFRKAIITFDSFMVSPLLRRRMSDRLAGHIARFHIARAVRYPEATAFITSYLWAHPNDGEIAEYWIQHTQLGEGADPDDLALADRIAADQPDNITILSLIAQTYLARRRTDYTALQIYKRLFQESSHVQASIVLQVADLFVQESRADEWALEVYLKANMQDPDRSDYLKGLAACQEQIRESERNRHLIRASRNALSVVDSQTLRQWKTSFQQAAAPPAPAEPAWTARVSKSIYGTVRRGFLGCIHAAGAGAEIFSGWVGTTGKFWRESSRTRHITKWTAVVLFAAVVIVSGISTIIYIQETKEPPEAAPAAAKSPPQIAASGSYTVQIASFRKRPLAESYSNQLERLGYNAYWGESRSSANDVWYYVRISRFETKQKAIEFAEDLKSKGIINDFYIANYKAP